jgi:hypothetical protein
MGSCGKAPSKGCQKGRAVLERVSVLSEVYLVRPGDSHPDRSPRLLDEQVAPALQEAEAAAQKAAEAGAPEAVATAAPESVPSKSKGGKKVAVVQLRYTLRNQPDGRVCIWDNVADELATADLDYDTAVREADRLNRQA